MPISVQPVTRRTRDEKDKLIVEDLFLIRDGEKVVGEAKTRDEAEKKAIEYKEVSAPLLEMVYTIEVHKRRSRDDKDNLIIEKGFLLRGNDGKFAQFSKNKEDLIEIVKKSGGKMADSRKNKQPEPTVEVQKVIEAEKIPVEAVPPTRKKPGRPRKVRK